MPEKPDMPDLVRYFYDFEFIEDGITIEPISVGIVCGDGREYYGVNGDVDLLKLKGSPWLIANVLPHLPLNGRGALEQYLDPAPEDIVPRTDLLALVDLDRTHTNVRTRQQIADEVRSFILAPYLESDHVVEIELWADYAAYDHVALAQLYGRMIDLPDGFPMFTRDVQDYARHLAVEGEYLPQPADDADHHALADAHLTRSRWRFLHQVEAGRTRTEGTPR